MTIHNASRTRRDNASVTTHTHTTHHVIVDVAHLLRDIDPGDEVVVVLETPSGRSKRVAIPANLLTPRAEDW